jgi:hypothetical protein
MWRSLGAKLGISTLATLAIGLSACGGEDDKTSAKDAVTTGTRGATAGVERFLLARGEEPGYQPSGPVEKLSSAEEFAARGPRPQAEARRLRDEGFVSFVRRPLEGKEGPGVTSLMLFTSAAGAKREAAAERRNLDVDFQGWKLKRFDVTGVPGAFGWTARKPGHRVGNITWVEGRCNMTLGNEVDNEETSSLVAPLIAGVRAVHRRVAGRCP